MKKFLALAALWLVSALPVHAQFSRINSITLQDNAGAQEAFYASPFTFKAGAACSWSISGTVATFNCSGSGIAGTIADTQVAFGTAADTIGGSADLTWDDTNKMLTLTAAAMQTTPLATFNYGGPATPCGFGTGTQFGAVCFSVSDAAGSGQGIIVENESDASFAFTLFNRTGGGSGAIWIGDDDTFNFATFGPNFVFDSPIVADLFQTNTATPSTTGTLRLAAADVIGWRNAGNTDNATLGLVSDLITAGTGALGYLGPKYNTTSNCSDSAGDAACGSASAGSVVVDAADTTTVVVTTAVSANSQIFVMFDSSLGTRLSVTCNATVALPSVTARTAGTSFTITVPAAPTTNPACYSYFIVN